MMSDASVPGSVYLLNIDDIQLTGENYAEIIRDPSCDLRSRLFRAADYADQSADVAEVISCVEDNRELDLRKTIFIYPGNPGQFFKDAEKGVGGTYYPGDFHSMYEVTADSGLAREIQKLGGAAFPLVTSFCEDTSGMFRKTLSPNQSQVQGLILLQLYCIEDLRRSGYNLILPVIKTSLQDQTTQSDFFHPLAIVSGADGDATISFYPAFRENNSQSSGDYRYALRIEGFTGNSVAQIYRDAMLGLLTRQTVFKEGADLNEILDTVVSIITYANPELQAMLELYPGFKISNSDFLPFNALIREPQPSRIERMCSSFLFGGSNSRSGSASYQLVEQQSDQSADAISNSRQCSTCTIL